MTNNFEVFRNYMLENGIPMYQKDMGDLFFQILVMRRGKDYPDLPAANYTFKIYYIDCIENYDKYKDEIIACCDIFNLRAYISVNVKSKEKMSKLVSNRFTLNIFNNEYKKPWRVFDHCFGKLQNKSKDVWIIDVDDDKDMEYINSLIGLMNSCDSKYENVHVMTIPTKSGYHILTRPFNLKQFKQLYPLKFRNKHIPEVKQNHITLLYENL